MKCPRCNRELPTRPPVRCSDCGWRPEDRLERFLADIKRAVVGSIPGVDPTTAGASLAHAGGGAALMLAELGLIERESWHEWTKRLMDAAGIAYEEVEFHAEASMTIEGDDEEDGDGGAPEG